MSAGTPLVLAVDLGSSSLKVALVDLAGATQGYVRLRTGVRFLPGGGAEAHPGGWWSALVTAVSLLLAGDPSAGRRVRAIAIASFGESTVPIGPDGAVLHPSLTWQDSRGRAGLERRFGTTLGRAGRASHLLRWLRVSGGLPTPTGRDPSAHLQFFLTDRPGLYERTWRFLAPSSYLTLRLSGLAVTTPDLAVSTWLTDNRDLTAVRYDDVLVRRAGIDPDKLPPIVPAAADLGPLTAAAAAELGLARAVRVVSGGIDVAISMLGTGAITPDIACLCVGTASWLGSHIPGRRILPLAHVASVPSVFTDRRMVPIVHYAGCSSLEAVAYPMLVGDATSAALAPELLDGLAAQAPAGSNGVLFLPWVWGERTPPDPGLRAGYLGMGRTTQRSDLARAALEGVALNSRRSLPSLTRMLGGRPQVLRMAGGGACSEPWRQVYADTLGLPIQPVVDPMLATVRGAGLVAWAGLGELALTDAERFVRLGEPVLPNPVAQRVMDERYEQFCRAIRLERRRMGRNQADLTAVNEAMVALGGAVRSLS